MSATSGASKPAVESKQAAAPAASLKVIVAVDGSRLSFKAIEVARRIIGDHGSLVMLHVADEKSSVTAAARWVGGLAVSSLGAAGSQWRWLF
jgi:hypothetical protein